METVKAQEPLVARLEVLKRSIRSSSDRLGLKMDNLETGMKDMNLKDEKQPHRRQKNRKKNASTLYHSERLVLNTRAKDTSPVPIPDAALAQSQVTSALSQDLQHPGGLSSYTPTPQELGNLTVQPPQESTNRHIQRPGARAGKPMVSLPVGAGNVPHCQPNQGLTPYEPIKSAPKFPKVPPWRVDKYHRFASHQAMRNSPTSTAVPPTLGRWTGSPPPTARYKLRSLVTDACKSSVPAEKTKTQLSSKSKSPEPLPVPIPTKAYLSLASRPAIRVQRPQCLLLILDLNGTLLYRKFRSPSYTPRLFLPQFLDYCLSNHNVLIWSSATPANVSAICARLFTPAQRAQLLGEWARDTLGLTPAQYVEKTQVYKRLDRIWADEMIQREHHWFDLGGRWTQHNTLLLDDSILKASAQPHNLVQMPEFTRTGDKQAGFDILGQVTSYLQEARMWDNVSSFVKSSRFEADKGWGWDWSKMRSLNGATATEIDQEDGGVRI